MGYCTPRAPLEFLFAYCHKWSQTRQLSFGIKPQIGSAGYRRGKSGASLGVGGRAAVVKAGAGGIELSFGQGLHQT